MTYKLTLAKVVKSCRKAIANGTLQAFNGTSRNPQYITADGKCRCAIGCAVPKRLAQRLEKRGMTVKGSANLLDCSDDIHSIYRIQLAHDHCVRYRTDTNFEDDFLRILDYYEKGLKNAA